MHKQNTSTAGFTIVELLIVIVVIAILAAISVVAYTGIQNRANNAAVEADISAIIKKLELAKIDLGHYPQSFTEFPNFKISKLAYDTSNSNVNYCLDKTNDVYAFGHRSKSGKAYIVDRGVITTGTTGYFSETCGAIGVTAGDANVYTVQGYTSSTSVWNSNWIWTN